MSTTRFYNVTVVCEGPVNGTWVRVVLAARQAVSPDSALSFLRQQARRIADGLDPAPGAGWVPPAILVPVPAPEPDVPTALRSWCHAPQARKAARDRLLAGAEFALGADDFTGRYTLRALPVPVPAYVLPRHAPRPARRRHRKPRWFDRFRLRLRLPGSFPFRRRARQRHARR
ncbi:hypothetical protein AB0P17_20705 [Streptomyces sp. NPDC088124]|uniref:hypothetical protein n=1 Tax=Streptomyces sp. NPDC088124 TaxID=3154654 RepID=UPI00342B1879